MSATVHPLPLQANTKAAGQRAAVAGSWEQFSAVQDAALLPVCSHFVDHHRRRRQPRSRHIGWRVGSARWAEQFGLPCGEPGP